jgi:hypothetical protein
MLALVALVVGTVPGDARAPATVERWGCTFKASLELIYGTEEGDWWIGAGDVACDTRRSFVVHMTMLRDTPGTPDRVIVKDTWTVWDRPGDPMYPESLKLGGGLCVSDGPARYPLYFRMRIEPKGEPGVAWAATPNGMNPCDEGFWPRIR